PGTAALTPGISTLALHDALPISTLAFSVGAHTLGATSSITGAGGVAFSGATVTLSGTYNVSGSTSVSGTVTFGPGATVASVGALAGSSARLNSSHVETSYVATRM